MYVVIMGGGAGKRFWPKSREAYPKQFLKLFGPKSLIRQSYERALKVTSKSKIFVVTHQKFGAMVKKELPGIPAKNIILEPSARNTAPCIALSLFYIRTLFGEEDILFVPADHLVGDAGKFARTVAAASKMAEKGEGLVIFGIKPRYAETGYGYIKKGSCIAEEGGVQNYRVDRFVEKPSAGDAWNYAESGEYLWNCGMFLFSQERLLASMRSFVPELYEGFASGKFKGFTDFSPKRMEKLYSKFKPVSIDYAVIEKEREVAVLEADFDWSDVGGWLALKEIWKGDGRGNSVKGTGFFVDSEGVIAETGKKLLVTLGIKDTVIVDTDDVVFVCSKEKLGKMKEMLEKMGEGKLKKYL